MLRSLCIRNTEAVLYIKRKAPFVVENFFLQNIWTIGFFTLIFAVQTERRGWRRIDLSIAIIKLMDRKSPHY
ncbi:hypothetical protein CLI75_10950 [Porphyromonas gingivalis]|nr:hypothetical protein A343_0155 [Porphyromonas gingivalis JCVI SC001]ERJ87876.1 hypothetical protein HMPREF1989_00512 [Porphyromonas gingivalis F0566]PDP39592.1 hypothetical protein CLI84_10590 [Porphyromonas gingivalis]PDP45317.1 hypothetical protein CLI82_10615 [Porphyromonas gingivalis]PDP54401.1 hypothetical protein CLI75_10950 [Porphyromonas gingivalis]